ncbi:MAG: hypothetical protein L0Y35_06205, partial [Flammeovirgaceae bacterium]|nr:hypothetical protein [Flammeovirgaceae bacterium]
IRLFVTLIKKTECVMYSTLTKSRLINVVLFACLAHFTLAQVVQSDRIEILLNNDNRYFEIALADQKGLYAYRPNGLSSLEIIHLDTALRQVWSGFLEHEKNYELIKAKTYQGNLYFLLRNLSLPDFLLLKIEEATGSFISHPIRNYLPFIPGEFEIIDKGCLIGGYFNRVPLVLYYDVKTEKPKVLPGLFNETGELNQIKVNDDRTFDVLIRSKNIERQQTIWIKSYDEDGDLLKNLPLEPETKKGLLFGRSIKTTNHLQIIAGVYGHQNTEYSRGIFIASLNQFGDQQLRYYSFGELENFFKFMKARREQRVKDRIERRKIKGKKLRFNYRFLVNELIESGEQFILMGEAFYPRYVQQSGLQRNFFSPSVAGPGYYQIFDGYRYTHAVLLGFDQSGHLNWDNSFEINDVKTFNLEQFVKIGSKGDTLSLLYVFENEIRSKLINKNQVVEGKTLNPLKVNTSLDRVGEGTTTMSKLDYWYSPYLVAYGTQLIESIVPGSGVTKRRVFFINKLRVK